MGEGGLLTLFKIRQNSKLFLKTNTLAYFKHYIINVYNPVCKKHFACHSNVLLKVQKVTF